jgi:hypothetical protein
VASPNDKRVCGEVRDPSGPLRSSRFERFVVDLQTGEVVVDPGSGPLQPGENRVFGKSAATDGRAFAEYFTANCPEA